MVEKEVPVFFAGEEVKGITIKKMKKGKVKKIKSSIPTVLLEKEDGMRFNYSLVKSATHFQPSYAFTVHKAQGSEFDKVAIVLDNKSMLLNNNLLYTAITRAKEKFEIYIKNGVDTELLKLKQENVDIYNLSNINDKEDYLKIA